MNVTFTQDQHVYIQVANILRNQIHYNQLKEKFPSIRELSKLYSINFKTANKAVAILIEEGLLYRIQGKGTFIVDSDSNIQGYSFVGLILSDIINPNFAHIAEEIQTQAYFKNMSIIINTSYRQIKRLNQILDMYRKRNVNAIIVQGGAIRDDSSLKLVLESGFPIVGDHTHLQGIDDVWLDVRAGAQMAVTHLIENFGERVAYISGSDEPIATTGRFQGYRDAMLIKSIKLDFRLIKSSTPTYRGGFDAVDELIRNKNIPRSIFLYNLPMAMGAINALTTNGRRIPENVAVVGCDNSIDVSEMVIPTTTVAFSYQEEAKQIMMLVERRLNNSKAAPLSIRIAPKLIIRQSSRHRRS